MYNLNLNPNETIIEVFNDTWIKQGENQKTTTIALTNQRLLFLDYQNQLDSEEVLRIAHGVAYQRLKEVYYQIDLSNIKSIVEDETYTITLNDETTFHFDNQTLYNLLINK